MGKPKARDSKRSLARSPKASPTATSSQQETPIFCFWHADRRTNGPWVFKPTAEHAPDLFNTICDLTRSKWSELEAQRTGGRKRHRKHHDQPITSLAEEAQQDIKRAKLDETFGGDIFRFRLAGEKRLWGFRNGRVFHVLWWDPDHDVYPSEPD